VVAMDFLVVAAQKPEERGVADMGLQAAVAAVVAELLERSSAFVRCNILTHPIILHGGLLCSSFTVMIVIFYSSFTDTRREMLIPSIKHNRHPNPKEDREKSAIILFHR
jgi:hypothetical protein